MWGGRCSALMVWGEREWRSSNDDGRGTRFEDVKCIYRNIQSPTKRSLAQCSLYTQNRGHLLAKADNRPTTANITPATTHLQLGIQRPFPTAGFRFFSGPTPALVDCDCGAAPVCAWSDGTAGTGVGEGEEAPDVEAEDGDEIGLSAARSG